MPTFDFAVPLMNRAEAAGGRKPSSGRPVGGPWRTVLVLMLLLATRPLASYCACKEPDISLRAAYAQADIVFVGDVTGIAFDYETGWAFHTFRVRRWYKGANMRTIRVGSSGECKYYFSRDEAYVVFASRLKGPDHKDEPYTSECAGNRLLRAAPDLKAVLGDGTPPRKR